MTRRVAGWALCLASGCGGSTGDDPPAFEASVQARARSESPASGQTTDASTTAREYSRQTDSATAHCYLAYAGEVAAPPDNFIGCWQRMTDGGALVSLELLGDGRFHSSFNGGDQIGVGQGVWEPASGGIVLLPPAGWCRLNDGTFAGACVRVFAVEAGGGGLLTAEQVAFDRFISNEWQRTECDLVEEGLDYFGPENERCSLDAIEPLPARLSRIEMRPSDASLGEGTLVFTTQGELPFADVFDMQRNLAPSMQAFALVTLEGAIVARFDEPVQRSGQEGEFAVTPGTLRTELFVRFLHRLEALPAELELRYEFRDAKYVADTGPRVERLSVSSMR